MLYSDAYPEQPEKVYYHSDGGVVIAVWRRVDWRFIGLKKCTYTVTVSGKGVDISEDFSDYRAAHAEANVQRIFMRDRRV